LTTATSDAAPTAPPTMIDVRMLANPDANKSGSPCSGGASC
jgi:hypothetical protein